MKPSCGLTAIAVIPALLATQALAQSSGGRAADCPPIPVCASEQTLICKFGAGVQPCGCGVWACEDKTVPLNLKLPSREPMKIDDLPKPPPRKFEPPPIPPSLLERQPGDPPKLKLDPPGDRGGS